MQELVHQNHFTVYSNTFMVFKWLCDRANIQANQVFFSSSVHYCDVHCLYMYFQFTSPEEESFLVRFYDSDTEEPSSMERLYVCLSDRFLEERNFGSGKVSHKILATLLIIDMCIGWPLL